MAFNGYDITPAAALAAIKNARDRFDDIDGIESKIDTTLAAAGTASNESKISSALDDVFDTFARPFVVTMIKSGRQTFTMGENLITTYQQADEDAGAYSAQKKDTAVTSMEKTLELIDDTPEYSESDTTGKD